MSDTRAKNTQGSQRYLIKHQDCHWQEKSSHTTGSHAKATVQSVGGAGQAMADGSKNKLNSETSRDLRLLTHSNPYSLPRVRKTFSTSFVPQPRKTTLL